MAGTFTSTGSYSNLTRLELEQLRKSDFYAGGKALTVGDSGLAPESVVGVGSINAEQYDTGPHITIDEVVGLVPPSAPGKFVGTSACRVWDDLNTAESVRWHGVDTIYNSAGLVGYAATATTFEDANSGFGSVLPGDILLIVASSVGFASNRWTTAVVDSATATTLTLSSINAPYGSPTTQLTVDSYYYRFTVVRPRPVQLFAIPGSGPLGQEQSFLFFDDWFAGVTTHDATVPNANDVYYGHVKNVAHPRINKVDSFTSVADRADAVFRGAGPAGNLEQLGYRPIFYRSNAAGTDPDLLSPIATLNPIIDSTIDIGDQRMTIDYKAGILRLSVAPRAGDDFKPTGGIEGVNPSTGRLQLYAVFFQIVDILAGDLTPAGAVRALYDQRTTGEATKLGAAILYDPVYDVWRMGQVGTLDADKTYSMALEALGDSSNWPSWDPGTKLGFGFKHDYFGSSNPFRGFRLKEDGTSSGEPQVTPTMIRQGRGLGGGHPTSARELVIADKTAITVGGGETPAQSPGGDYNPTAKYIGFVGDTTEQAQTLRAAFIASAIEGYGTVHLRKGKYFIAKTVNVPPGVMVEGEGRATQLESKFISGYHFYWPTVFKFGPNTSWGVYDFDTDEVGASPAAVETPFVQGSTPQCTAPYRDWGSTGNLEGLDCVWNPTRRVWGVVYADLDTNSIWFDEINPDGTSVLGPNMLNVKDGSANLFTYATGALTNVAEYTPAHYPRISHQPFTDEYAVVWVEERSAPDGPAVHWNVVVPTFAQGAVSFATRFPNSIDVAPGGLTTQPSIASSPQVSGGVYTIGISSSNSFTPGGTNMSGRWRIFDATTGTETYSGDLGLSGGHVISGSDVSEDGESGFLFCWSARRHAVIHGTTGVYIHGSPNCTLTDPAYPDFAAVGVAVGSRVLVVGPTAADRGYRGVVQAVSVGTLNVRWDNNETLSNVVGTFDYYIIPRSTIYTIWHNGATAQVPRAAVGGRGTPKTVPATTLANVYLNDIREPDFPRLSKGDDGWILVYQSFDTNTFLSKNTIKNWDGGFNTNLIDQTGGVALSQSAHRLHLSTCFVLIGAQGYIKGPGATNLGGWQNTGYSGLSTNFVTTPNHFYTRAASDSTTSQRALGGRVMALPNNNGITVSTAENWEMSIGARFYSIPWSETRPCSFIPDVTWSGQDWTVVSPSVNRIESDTGQYIFTGGNYYLSDPTMIWGGTTFQDNGIDGTPLPGTVAGGYAYFPAVDQYASIVTNASNTHSEHVIQLSGAVPGLTIGNVYTWRLVMGGSGTPEQSYNVTKGGIKNPGYRVNPDGEVTVSTNFWTFAEEPRDVAVIAPDTYPAFYRSSEVIYRAGMWGDDDKSGGGTLLFGDDRTTPGSKINWNDLIPGSRIDLDLHYRGVAVGSPKGCSEVRPDEFPMLAISWGDNFYGFVDRVLTGSVNAPFNTLNNLTCFYRQSFGPWGSGLKDMAIRGAQQQKFRLEARNHIFTRHGWLTGGNPFFATDGFRNFFAHINFDGFNDTAGVVGYARANPYEESSYRGGVNGVYTNALGSDALRIRGPIIPGPPSTEPAQNQWGYNIDRNYIIPAQAHAPRVIWDGKDFVAFYAHHVIQCAHDPDHAGATPWIGANNVEVQPKVRGVVSMVRFPGSEGTDWIPNELTGINVVEGNTTPAVMVSRPNAPRVVASSILHSMSGDGEARQMILIDVAFSGKVFCVVWTMGLMNTNHTNYQVAAGGSMIGYSLFPVAANPPSDTTFASDLYPVKGMGVPAHTIDVVAIYASYADQSVFSSPKVVWDGHQFVITFAHMDNLEDGGLSTATRRNIPKCVCVPEEGFGHKQQIKAIGADNVIKNMGDSSELRLGVINNSSLVLDNVNIALPLPGDLLVITKDTGTNLNVGTYGIVSFNPRTRTVYLSTDLQGGPIDAYGHIQSGGLPAGHQAIGGPSGGVLNPSIKTSLPLPAGVDVPATALATMAQPIVWKGWISGAPQPLDVSRIVAMEYDWKTGEYIILYHDGYFDDLYITSFTLPEGRCREPVALFFSGTGASHAMAFNGDTFLVVTANYNFITFYHVTRDFQVLSNDNFGEDIWFDGNPHFLGNTNGTWPGPQYGSGIWADCFGVHVVWNDKLNKWSVSVSWVGGYFDWVKNYEYGTAGTPYTYWNYDVTAWSGRTMTHGAGSPNDYIAGLRYVATWEEPITSGTADFSNPNYMSMFAAGDDFIADSVAVGDSIWFSGPWGDMYRIVEKVRDATHLSINLPYYDPPGTAVTFESYTIVRPQTYYWWNVLSRSGNQSFTDVDSTEVSDVAGFISNQADFKKWILPREDTFLLTFSSGLPAVEVLDADGVSIDNVWFSGVADISECYINLARQVHKSGGVEIGEVTADSATAIRYIRRPKVGVQLSTPAGKVDTLTLTNVRSTALGKYGWKLNPNGSQERNILPSSNQRK